MTLHTLLATPNLDDVSPIHARLVCAMRYVHLARCEGKYSCRALAAQIGTSDAVRPFHVFMDETGRAWPEPIALNRPCQMALSYDEMLLVDLCTAAARNERGVFDELVEDMIGRAGRNSIWTAARRLMSTVVVIVR